MYASYGARFEGRIVKRLIEADGGSGEFTETVLPMLGIWNTLLEGKVGGACHRHTPTRAPHRQANPWRALFLS